MIGIPEKVDDIGLWLMKLGGAIFLFAFFVTALLTESPSQLHYVGGYATFAGLIIVIIGVILDKE